ncbi:MULTISPECIES: Smr/MutS family protein [Methylobacterium]|uniref:Endonuclease MutS2 n=1 Tax=Methylobacterium bullatum TaxID=570505 RepID=A0AAV4Z4W6_9HYPH|nr:MULTISPECIES: Smr/MutS family protein [Methylobacterium]TXN33208.1 DNA mismatch repair protein MutS [Methylobacterium sp. WL19]GJD39001.1 Endonuclease MutS2 [Methylobacterium bullatum]
MRLPRRPRGLSGEDAFLWGEIARLITPLRGRAVPIAKTPIAKAPATGNPPPPRKKPEPPGLAAKPVTKPVTERPALPGGVKAPVKRIVKPIPAPSPVAAPATVVTAPPLPGLERKARLALRRGSLKVEARIDLHGMYQAEAHGALVGFLMRCRSAGHAHVLVVTGKGGGSGFDEAFSERGVLRRQVPHWLRSPELRSIVIGFEEAARHHGGAGALYVRLRRR